MERCFPVIGQCVIDLVPDVIGEGDFPTTALQAGDVVGAELVPIRCRSRGRHGGQPGVIGGELAFLCTMQKAQHGRGIEGAQSDLAQGQSGHGFAGALPAYDHCLALRILAAGFLFWMRGVERQCNVIVNGYGSREDPFGGFFLAEVLANHRRAALAHGLATDIESEARRSHQRGKFRMILRQ